MLQIFPHVGELRTRALRWSPLLLIAIVPMTYIHFRNGKTESKGGEFEAKVEKKEFRQLLRLNGTTQASRSFVVLAPRLEGAQVGSMVITKLAPVGMQVKKEIGRASCRERGSIAGGAGRLHNNSNATSVRQREITCLQCSDRGQRECS